MFILIGALLALLQTTSLVALMNCSVSTIDATRLTSSRKLDGGVGNAFLNTHKKMEIERRKNLSNS